MHFIGVKKLRKSSGFVIYSYLKDSAFTAVKRDAKYVKHVPLKVYESGTFSRNLPTKKNHCQVIDSIHHLKTGNL